jgi:hypothetical protein
MAADEPLEIPPSVWAELDRARMASSRSDLPKAVTIERPNLKRYLTGKGTILLLLAAVLFFGSVTLKPIELMSVGEFLNRLGLSMRGFGNEAALRWPIARFVPQTPLAIVCMNTKDVENLSCFDPLGSESLVRMTSASDQVPIAGREPLTQVSPHSAANFSEASQVFSQETDLPNQNAGLDSSEARAWEWWSATGGMFSAEVCRSLPSPRLGCQKLPRADARQVLTVQITDSAYMNLANHLAGTWQNQSHVLRVDPFRAQASLSRDSPFEWQKFRVREGGREEIVFTIGAQVYVAKLDNTSLVLSSTSFRGDETLTRTSVNGFHSDLYLVE